MKILYICTHNRCRSVLSEALSNHFGEGLIEAKSAGSAPAGEVHPLTLKYLAQRDIDISNLHSKSWDTLEGFCPDVVVTVCDSAAKETCPLWMNDHLVLHWGLPDPSKIEGSEAELRDAFYAVMATIEKRVRSLAKIARRDFEPEQLREVLQTLAI